MAQMIPHTGRHPEAGKWARSMWQWHIVGWQLEPSYNIEAASECDKYLHPPYLDHPPFSAVSICDKCQRLAGVPKDDRLVGTRWP